MSGVSVDKIFHIADIHIRNFKRHTEYRAVFKKMYRYLKKHATKKSLIYLAGDIVHSKNDMSPELVKMVSDFLNSCANIAPTVLIAGNHDANLNNDARLDALTPIVDAINNPNLMYWKDTGVYEYGGIMFSVFSVFGDPNQWILADDIDGAYKIALHHGAVSSALTDLDYEITNELITPSIFKGFDLGLLGDIHRTQFLDSEKTVAYAGSLIQQNHGEGLVHGFMVWDVQTKSCEFVQIENNIGYATLEISDGSIINDDAYINTWPKNIRLRIKYSNTSYKEVQAIFKNLKKKHKFLETTLLKINDYEYNSNEKNTILGDVRDVEYQNKLITMYLESGKHETAADPDSVRHANRVMNSKLQKNEVIVRNVVWKPLTFEFDNMFSYGSNNKIDFANFKGVKGLFAPNASGKSTLLDAITYCLFDKCSRTYRSIDVLNTRKSSFRCKLVFELNNTIYSVERVAKKHKRTGKVRVDVTFMQESDDGPILLNGKDRDSTNKIIRGYIGTYDDFLLTALSTQNDNKNFIFKTQKERKELLNSFLDISVFDELYLIARDEIKGYRFEIKSLEQEINDDQYLNLSTDIEIASREYTECSSSFVESDHLVEELTNNINKLKNSLKFIESPIDIVQVSNDIAQLVDEKNIGMQSINNKQSELDELLISLEELHNNLSEYNIDKIKKDRDHIVALTKEVQLKKNEYIKITTELQHLNEVIEHLKNHEYDPECNFCVNSNFVKSALEAKKKHPELDKQSILLQKSISKLETEVSNLLPHVEKLETDIEDIHSNISEKSKLRETLANEIEIEKYKIINLTDKIYQLEQQKIQYKKQKEQQIKNERIESKISQVQNTLDSEKQQYKLLQNNMMTYNSKLTALLNIEEILNNKKTRLAHLYEHISVYEAYLAAVSKYGVPYMLLQKILPVIEDEVNNTLSQIVEFYITLESDEKNINCYIHYNDELSWPVELASGMERFMISVATRSALINVSSLPRPNFLAIDEGFGTADSSTIASMPLLFDYIITQFDFLLIVTHIDSLKDSVDSVLNIDKVDNYSKISNID